MNVLLSLFLLFTLAGTVQAQESPLQIADPWVREAPPTARVLGLFMQLRNAGDEELVIEGASSPLCERVEIHRTVLEEGMARMIAQPELRLAPGETLSLEPGSYHLMLIGPHRALVAGDELEVVIRYNGAHEQAIMAPVVSDRGEIDHSHHHHHH
jgi:copper(I)-binding protein